MQISFSQQAATRLPEFFVDSAEAAKFLKIHSRTLQQMARDGIVPGYPIGEGIRKTWRFVLSELDDWMRKRNKYSDQSRRPHTGKAQ
jgi:excisionase family DNA binding protein